jgi:ribosomal protein S18 acetylase RimI-like enzyme
MTKDTDANKIDYRPAVLDDETDILEVLEEVAPEIPVKLDGPERQSKIKSAITERRESGKSWVAVDEDGAIVGFALARPDVYENQAAIYIDYVGVRTDLRRRRIFTTLMEKLKANNVHLIANVLHDNRSSMVDVLADNGFTKTKSEFDAKQTKLVWSPAQKKSEG